MHKVRGFEKVSFEQFKKDVLDEFYLEEEVCRDMYDNINIPIRATALSAGYDCYSTIDFTLRVGQEIKIPTGIKSYMQSGEVLLAYPRSSLGFKYSLKLCNTIGVIDADYVNNEKNEGHIFVKLRNHGDNEIKVKTGDAICQFIFTPFLLADGDNFKGKERKGGFGSTNA